MGGGLKLDVDIRGHNRDFLRAIAGSQAAMKQMRAEQAKTTLTARALEFQQRRLNDALREQSRALKGLTLDYVSVRRAMLTLGVRALVSGFAAITAGATSAAGAVGLFTNSIVSLGGAVGVGGASILGGLVQGFTVAKFALDGIGKAMTTTGKAHEKALAKLTKPARAFVGELQGVQKEIRRLKLIAQDGMMPGLVKGLKAAKPLTDEIRQAVSDTAETLGYLAERAGTTLGEYQNQVERVLQRNVITMRRMGDSVIDVGAGLTDAMVAAEPLIGRMTSDIRHFAGNFKKYMGKNRDGVRGVFNEFRTSWENWTATLGATVGSFGNIWDAGLKPMHEMEDGIEETMKNLREWTGTHKPEIEEFFEDSLDSSSELAKTIGDLVKTFGEIGMDDKAQENFRRIMRGLRDDLFPLMKDFALSFNEHILPALMDTTKSLLEFIKEARPGLETLGTGVSLLVRGLGSLLDVASKIVKVSDDLFGGAGAAIATLTVGTAIIASWKALRAEMSLALLAGRSAVGLTDKARPTGRDFRSAMPFYTKGSFYSGIRGAPGALVGAAGRSYTMGVGRGPLGRMMGYQTSAQGRMVGGLERPRIYEGVGPAVPRSTTYPIGGPMPPVARRDSNGRWRGPDGRYTSPPQGIYMTPSGRVRVRGQRGNLPASGVFGTGDADRDMPRRTATQTAVRTRPGRFGEGPVRRGFQISTRPGDVERIARAEVVREMKTAGRGVRQGIVQGVKGMFKGPGGGGNPLKGSGLGSTIGITALLSMLPIVGTNLGRGLSNKTPEFNLPKNRRFDTGLGGIALGKNIPVWGKTPLGNPIGFAEGTVNKALGMFDKGDEKLQKFGETAEETFKKLKKASDGAGLNKLADQARAMAKEFPDAGSSLLKFADAAERASGSVGDQFAEMRRVGGKNLRDIRQAVVDTTVEISGRMGSDTRKGKEALAHNFRLAAQAVKKSMDAGKISAETGLAQINKLMRQSLAEFGIKGKAAGRYLAGGDTVGGGVTDQPLGGGASSAHFNNKKARGGLMQLGAASDRGQDNIPMMLNGRPVLAAAGENVAVFNRHQRAELEQMLAANGYNGMQGFFGSVNTPHHMARGGLITKASRGFASEGGGSNPFAGITNIVALGRALQRMGYEVGENPAFGGVAPVHDPDGYHPKGLAIDVNDDDAPGGEAASLDRLFGKLKGLPGIVELLWRVKDHYDHLHVAMSGSGPASGINFGGGSGGIIKQIDLLKRVRAKGAPDGPVGAIVQAGLDRNRAAANELLRNVGGTSFPMGGKGGAGSLSRGEVANLMRRAGFPESQIPIGLEIAFRESRYNPHAANPTSSARGLWQILLGAHPTVSEAEAFDPWFATQYAYHLWQQSGWQPWEVAPGVPGALGRGGLISSSLGTVFGGMPKRQDGVPKVNIDDAIPDADRGKKKKSKKKDKKKKKGKKGPEYPSGKKPRSKAYGRNLLTKPSQLKALKNKGKRNRKISLGFTKAFAKKKFNIKDPGSLTDPITGEDLPVESLPILKALDGLVKGLDPLEIFYSTRAGIHGLTEEQPTVTLDNGEEIVNWDGATVGGRFIGGIHQHLDELYEQLGIRQRVRDNYGAQEGAIAAIGDQPEKAIEERRERLKWMKKVFAHQHAVRKSMEKKIRKMNRRNYSWKDAVEDNEDLLDKWKKFKRDGSRLPEKYRENIDNIMDRIRGTNKDLRKNKPEGGDKLQRQRYLNDYQAAGAINKYLLGEADANVWDPSQGGRARQVLQSLSTWQQVKDYRDGASNELKTAIPGEDLTLAGIRNEISDWGGTILPPNASKSALDEEKSNLLKEENLLLKQQMNLNNAQFKVFKGFMPLLQGRLVGSFFRGGVIPETGMALVHKGERILPDPDGGFRTGMNAPTFNSNPNFTLVLRGDGLGDIITAAEMRVENKVVKLMGERQGVQARRLSAAPGAVRRGR